MTKLRNGNPPAETWEVKDVMDYLGCDKETAENIMDECREKNNLNGYGAIEKHILLDFINEKQRIEREREARHQSDLANADIAATHREQLKTLKEQVKALYDMSKSSSEDAHKARTQALVSNIIAILSFVLAVLTLILKLN